MAILAAIACLAVRGGLKAIQTDHSTNMSHLERQKATSPIQGKEAGTRHLRRHKSYYQAVAWPDPGSRADQRIFK